jgi:hypothetical protein
VADVTRACPRFPPQSSMVRRGRWFESARGLHEGPANRGFFFPTERRVSERAASVESGWKPSFRSPSPRRPSPERTFGIELWSAAIAKWASGGRSTIFERWESPAARETFRSSGPDKGQRAAMLTVAVQEYTADVRPVFGERTA